MKLVSYNEENVNIGDALQTLTLFNFIKNNYNDIEIDGYSERTGLENKKVIINGWHRREKEPLPYVGIYIGIHTNYEQTTSIKENTLIGCRDMFTLKELKRNKKIKGIFSGCSTINIPFYEGKRDGGTVEYIHEDKKTGFIPFEEQLKMANDLIEQLKTKELVITNRLHVAIPCIALGTPVIINPRDFQQERFTIFDYFKEFPGYNKTIRRESGLKERMEEVFKDAFEEILFNHKLYNKLELYYTPIKIFSFQQMSRNELKNQLHNVFGDENLCNVLTGILKEDYKRILMTPKEARNYVKKLNLCSPLQKN